MNIYIPRPKHIWISGYAFIQNVRVLNLPPISLNLHAGVTMYNVPVSPTTLTTVEHI